jgi:hypothetical protein
MIGFDVSYLVQYGAVGFIIIILVLFFFSLNVVLQKWGVGNKEHGVHRGRPNILRFRLGVYLIFFFACVLLGLIVPYSVTQFRLTSAKYCVPEFDLTGKYIYEGYSFDNNVKITGYAFIRRRNNAYSISGVRLKTMPVKSDTTLLYGTDLIAKNDTTHYKWESDWAGISNDCKIGFQHTFYYKDGFSRGFAVLDIRDEKEERLDGTFFFYRGMGGNVTFRKLSPPA